MAQVYTAQVEEKVCTFRAGRGKSTSESVIYSPDCLSQGLDKVSNVAPLGEYK